MWEHVEEYPRKLIDLYLYFLHYIELRRASFFKCFSFYNGNSKALKTNKTNIVTAIESKLGHFVSSNMTFLHNLTIKDFGLYFCESI